MLIVFPLFVILHHSVIVTQADEGKEAIFEKLGVQTCVISIMVASANKPVHLWGGH